MYNNCHLKIEEEGGIHIHIYDVYVHIYKYKRRGRFQTIVSGERVVGAPCRLFFYQFSFISFYDLGSKGHSVSCLRWTSLKPPSTCAVERLSGAFWQKNSKGIFSLQDKKIKNNIFFFFFFFFFKKGADAMLSATVESFPFFHDHFFPVVL